MNRVLTLFLALSAAAYSASRDFDSLVKAVENHYGVKRTHIPLMGVANFFVKAVRPAGTSGFKLAIFEDLPDTGEDRDPKELDRFINQLSSSDLHALVVTHSRASGEATYILAGEIGKSTKMLVATFERHEATLVEVTVDMNTLLRMIGSPDQARRLAKDDTGDSRGW